MPLIKFGVVGKILIVCAALVLAVLVYDLCVRTWIKMRNRKPVETVKAKVVFKEVQKNIQDAGFTYSVCFLTVDGKPVELFPKQTEYDAMEVGQKGALTYQGSQFIRFEAEQ